MTVSELRPPMLADALKVLLPHPVQASFLRACLLDGPGTRQAWLDWMRTVGDPLAAIRRDELGLKPWLPLLLESARRGGAAATQSGLSVLRIAHFREELRTKTFRRICARALAGLRDAGVPFVLVGGAALADTVYAAPMLRHCHDIDVLVEASGLDGAGRALARCGFSPAPAVSRARTGQPCLQHATGLCVELHTDLPGSRFYPQPTADAWRRAGEAESCGVRVGVLSPADALLQVLGKVSSGPCHRKPCWMLDAWHIIGGAPPVGWNVLTACIEEAGAALPMFLLLDYLARELEAPVPVPVLDRLRAAAVATSRFGGEVALGSATSDGRRGIQPLMRAAQTSESRIFVVRWITLPSARYLRHVHGRDGRRAMPLLHARHVLSRLAALRAACLPG